MFRVIGVRQGVSANVGSTMHAAMVQLLPHLWSDLSFLVSATRLIYEAPYPPLATVLHIVYAAPPKLSFQHLTTHSKTEQEKPNRPPWPPQRSYSTRTTTAPVRSTSSFPSPDPKKHEHGTR